MSSPVKILQVCAIDITVEALLKPLILNSMDKGYIVHNACTDTGKFNRLKELGLQMINISIERKINPYKNAKSIWQLYKLMKKEKYDIVHVHTPVAALLGRIAAKLAGVKSIVYTAHGFYFHEDMSKRTYRLFYLIEKYAARYLTDWLLLQSKEDYEFALRNNFLSKNRIIHLSNGVEIWNKFHPGKIKESDIERFYDQQNLTKEDFIFSFIGRMVREKGVFELVEAFKNISLTYPQAKLLLVGEILESERDHESYHQLIKEFDHKNIRYLGYREDTPLLLKASSVFVLPSHREGLPRSIIEAMAMGKPIIATDVRGCREEVFPNENGYLVEKENVSELTDAMKNILIKKELAHQFSNKSREISEELFDEEKVLEKQMRLFQKIIEQ